MSATYDITTDLGFIRHLIKDDDVTAGAYRHSDEEIEAFMSRANSDVYLTAAMLCESDAAGVAQDADIIRLGPFGDNTKTVFDALITLAKYFRSKSINNPSIDPPDAVFTFTIGDEVGTMEGW